MHEPVNAADVLPAHAEYLLPALLAHGGGDPVVVMPDGTLRRGERLTLWRSKVTGLHSWIPRNLDHWEQVEHVILTDPVVPE